LLGHRAPWQVLLLVKRAESRFLSRFIGTSGAGIGRRRSSSASPSRIPRRCARGPAGAPRRRRGWRWSPPTLFVNMGLRLSCGRRGTGGPAAPPWQTANPVRGNAGGRAARLIPFLDLKLVARPAGVERNSPTRRRTGLAVAGLPSGYLVTLQLQLDYGWPPAHWPRSALACPQVGSWPDRARASFVNRIVERLGIRPQRAWIRRRPPVPWRGLAVYGFLKRCRAIVWDRPVRRSFFGGRPGNPPSNGRRGRGPKRFLRGSCPSKPDLDRSPPLVDTSQGGGGNRPPGLGRQPAPFSFRRRVLQAGRRNPPRPALDRARQNGRQVPAGALTIRPAPSALDRGGSRPWSVLGATCGVAKRKKL